jgi:hypothetical protein
VQVQWGNEGYIEYLELTGVGWNQSLAIAKQEVIPVQNDSIGMFVTCHDSPTVMFNLLSSGLRLTNKTGTPLKLTFVNDYYTFGTRTLRFDEDTEYELDTTFQQLDYYDLFIGRCTTRCRHELGEKLNEIFSNGDVSKENLADLEKVTTDVESMWREVLTSYEMFLVLHIRNLLILKEAEKKKKITFSGDKITSMSWNLIKWLRTNFPSYPGDADLEEEDSASQLSGEGDSRPPLPNTSKTSRKGVSGICIRDIMDSIARQQAVASTGRPNTRLTSALVGVTKAGGSEKKRNKTRQKRVQREQGGWAVVPLTKRHAPFKEHALNYASDGAGFQRVDVGEGKYSWWPDKLVVATAPPGHNCFYPALAFILGDPDLVRRKDINESNPSLKGSDGVSFHDMNKALSKKKPALRLEKRPKMNPYYKFLSQRNGCFIGRCKYGAHYHYVGYDGYRGLFLDRGHSLVQVEPSDYEDNGAAKRFFDAMGASALCEVRELVENLAFSELGPGEKCLSSRSKEATLEV